MAKYTWGDLADLESVWYEAFGDDRHAAGLRCQSGTDPDPSRNASRKRA